MSDHPPSSNLSSTDQNPDVFPFTDTDPSLTVSSPDLSAPAWYCLQTAPKQESKVAILIEREVGVPVYAPKIRFRRNRAGTPIWWTEALFPGYVFARFSFFEAHRQIRALTGVSSIVRFGDRPAALSDELLSALREAVGESDTVEVGGITEPATEVLVIEGPFKGLQLLVTRILPARERIAVLMEFLGMEREIEIDLHSTIPVNPRTPTASGSIRRD